ncbi:TPA: hypothetical protein EYP66_09550 [Candidatus Poribacteria bacterium]|nr:hypothetical protein [Candidatus Poribacteria bacterium]
MINYDIFIYVFVRARTKRGLDAGMALYERLWKKLSPNYIEDTSSEQLNIAMTVRLVQGPPLLMLGESGI